MRRADRPQDERAGQPRAEAARRQGGPPSPGRDHAARASAVRPRGWARDEPVEPPLRSRRSAAEPRPDRGRDREAIWDRADPPLKGGRKAAPGPAADEASARNRLGALRESAAMGRLEALRDELGAARVRLEAAWRRLDSIDDDAETGIQRAARAAAAAGRDPITAARAQRRAHVLERAALRVEVSQARRAADAALAAFRAAERAALASTRRTAALEAAARMIAAPPKDRGGGGFRQWIPKRRGRA